MRDALAYKQDLSNIWTATNQDTCLFPKASPMLGSRSLASATEERDKASVVMGVDGAGEGREGRGREEGGARDGRCMGAAERRCASGAVLRG